MANTVSTVNIDELYSNFPYSILLQLYFIVPKIRKNSINHQYKLKSGFEDNSAFVVNKFLKFFALNFVPCYSLVSVDPYGYLIYCRVENCTE